MTDSSKKFRAPSYPTAVARRDYTIDEINQQTRDLMYRAARGEIGIIEKFFHVRREGRAAEALAATGAKLKALEQVARAATDCLEAAMDYRNARVRYEAQTVMLPHILGHELASYAHAFEVAAIDRNTKVSAALIENTVTTAERAASEAKLRLLIDKLDHTGRRSRVANGDDYDDESDLR